MTRHYLTIGLAGAMLLLLGTALEASAQWSGKYTEIELYPEGQDSNKGITENGVQITSGAYESNGYGDKYEKTSPGWINENGYARLRIYMPENCNGQMVLSTPGGGYGGVSIWNEGENVARWLNSKGIACCVVCYRLPNKHCNVPLTDVQNAFRYCRAHSFEWGIRQIGIIGFSAGGHLAASASTLFVDEITRPDFSILIYPVITMEKSLTHFGTMDNLTAQDPAKMAIFSLEKQVTRQTPPTFIALSSDDTLVPPENSIMYYQALLEHKVKAQMYIFPSGGHGWGFPSDNGDGLGKYRKDFFSLLEKFLEEVYK